MRPTCRKVAGLVCDGEYSHTRPQPPTPATRDEAGVPAHPRGSRGHGRTGPGLANSQVAGAPCSQIGVLQGRGGTSGSHPALLGFLFHRLQPSLWLLWLPHFKDESKVECLARGRRGLWLFPPRGFVPALQSPPHPHSLASRTDSAAGQL